MPPKKLVRDTPPRAEKALVQRLNEEAFFALCQSYQDRNAISAYGYRLYPRIQRKPKYIFKIENPEVLSRQWLIHKFGSGIYELTFNDANRRPITQLAVCKVNIEELDRPPVLDLSELDMDHPDNRSYIADLRGRGLLPAAPVPGASAVPDHPSLVGLVSQLTQQQNGRSDLLGLAAVLKAVMPEQRDPFDIAIKMKELAAGSGNGGASDKLIAAITAALQANSQAFTTLATQLRGSQQEDKSELERLAGTLAGLRELGIDLRPGKAAAGGSWVSDLVHALPEVLKAAGGIMSSIAVIKSSERRGRRGAPASESPAAVAVATDEGAAGADSAARATQDDTDSACDPLAHLFGDGSLSGPVFSNLVTQALKAYQDGTTGSAFAAGLDSFSASGKRLYRNVLDSATADSVMAQLIGSGRLQFLTPDDREGFGEFVHDFFEYDTRESPPEPGTPS